MDLSLFFNFFSGVFSPCLPYSRYSNKKNGDYCKDSFLGSESRSVSTAAIPAIIGMSHSIITEQVYIMVYYFYSLAAYRYYFNRGAGGDHLRANTRLHS